MLVAGRRRVRRIRRGHVVGYGKILFRRAAPVGPLGNLSIHWSGKGRDVKTLVDQAVREALRDRGGEAVRLYVAACTERMAPLFIGLRAGVPRREADLDLYAESVRDLWFADRPLAGAAERVLLLERFPELQPQEEAISDVADTYAFFAALCLRYVLPAHGSGSADDAVSCGHAALTAMGMLDRNTAGAGFLAEERRLQNLSVSGDASGLWEASVSAGRERFRAVVGRLPAGRALGRP